MDTDFIEMQPSCYVSWNRHDRLYEIVHEHTSSECPFQEELERALVLLSDD